jgi:hypothetical protein
VPGPCVLDSLQLLCGSDEYNHGVFQNAGVYCCHTTVTELDSTFDENYAGNAPVPAMNPTVLNLVWQNDNWHGLGFDAPFAYNGTDNLIMEFRWQGDDNNSVYDRGWYTPGNRACNASSSTAPSGTPRNYMPRFRIFYSAVGITEEAPLSEARHDMRTATVVAAPPTGQCSMSSDVRRTDPGPASTSFPPRTVRDQQTAGAKSSLPDSSPIRRM